MKKKYKGHLVRNQLTPAPHKRQGRVYTAAFFALRATSADMNEETTVIQSATSGHVRHPARPLVRPAPTARKEC